SLRSFFFYSFAHTRTLHSFPTRRSSDLDGMIRRLAFPGPSINRSCCHGTRTTRTSPRPRTDDEPRRRRPDVPADRRTVSDLSERSEEHTSELQSRGHLVCRLLLEKKKNE